MKWSRVPFVLAVASMPVWAANDSYPRAKMNLVLKDYQVEMQDFVFGSGLRVIFQEDHSQPVVSITSVTDRGSTSDPPGLEGIAHVVEHMWFRSQHKGADGKDLPNVWDLIEEMGGGVNAFTADDQTVYMTVASADKLIPLLRLEGLRMRDGAAGIKNEVLLVEREVVRNELRMRYENDSGAIWGHVLVRLYPKDHPYGKTAYAGIGSHDSLNAITLADIQKFFKDNYRPELTTILVVGDFDSDQANELLQEIGTDLMVDPKFPDAGVTLVEPKSRITGPAIEPPPPVSPAEVKGQVSAATVPTVKGAVEKPFVALAWTTPSGWREGDTLAQVAASQLQLGIYQELNPDWIYSTDEDPTGVDCGAQPGTQGSAVYCTIELAAGGDGVKKASQALDGLYRVWTISEDELSRKFMQYSYDYGKFGWASGILSGVDLIAALFTDRVTGAAMFAHYTGDVQYFSRNFEWLNKVQPDAVRAFAAKYLNRKRAVAVVMEPYEGGDILTDTSDAGYRGARKDDEVDSIASIESLSDDAVARAMIAPDATKIHETKLANGGRLVVMPYTESPIVRMQVIFEGGSASPADHLGYFAQDMIANNSWDIDSLRVAGADGGMFDVFTSVWYAEGSAGNLADLMFVMRKRLDELYPDTNGKIDWADDQKKSIVDDLDDPFAMAEQQLQLRVAAGHPSVWFPDHAAVDRLARHSAADVEKFYASVVRPENATLVVVGNVTVAETEEAAKTYFENWKGWRQQTPVPLTTEWSPWTAMPDRTVLLLNKDNASQTDVTYACQLPTLTPEEVPAVRVLGEVLSGQAWKALREQTGASYGAGAGAQVTLRGGLAALFMSSLVQNDSAVLAVKSFLGIGEKAKEGAVDPKLLAVRKMAAASSYVLGHQSTGQMLSRLVGVYGNRLDKTYFEAYRKGLASVDTPQLQRMLERCVGHEVVTAVGPIDVIKPAFDAANIPVEVYDWEQARLDYAAKYNVKSILKAEEKKAKEKAKETKK